MSTNESAVSHRKVKESSDRSFGLVFATVFGLIGAWPWLFGREPRLWAFAAAALFLDRSFLIPAFAHLSLLCAFTGIPFWRCSYIIIRRPGLVIVCRTFVAADPRKERLAANQLPATKPDGRNRRASRNAAGDGLADMSFRAVE